MSLDAWDKFAAEALERAEKATGAPWSYGRIGRSELCIEGQGREPVCQVHACEGGNHDANAAFIIEARSDVPALAAALREATAEIRRLRGEADRSCPHVATEVARAATSGTMQHAYEGLCPDAHDPDSRDPQCLACRALPAPGTIVKVTEVVGEFLWIDGGTIRGDGPGEYVGLGDLVPPEVKDSRGIYRIRVEFTPGEP